MSDFWYGLLVGTSLTAFLLLLVDISRSIRHDRR